MANVGDMFDDFHRQHRIEALDRIDVLDDTAAIIDRQAGLVGMRARNRDIGFGRIDAVVNNAGGAPPADAATASPRFSESIVRLNLLAPLHVAQRANHHMQLGDGGVIVNIASVSATRPSPGTAAYGAAKAGLLNLTSSLAVEWAPKVRVVAIVAGLIETEQAELHYGDAESVARVAATVPAGRLGTPEDLAQACRWLTSPLSEYMSGTAVWLHGGGEKPAFLSAVESAAE